MVSGLAQGLLWVGVMKRCPLIVLVLGALWPLVGCSPYVHSPAAQTVPLESAKALQEGETAMRVEGSVGGQVFGPGVTSGKLQVRHGFRESLEGSAQADLTYLGGSEEWDSDALPLIGSARLGVKYAPLDWFALTAGLGGGASAGGGFISPDAGVIFSYENRYFVPLLSFGGYYSAPIHARHVRFFDDDGDVFIGKPDRTGGAYLGAGARIPLNHDKDHRTKSAIVFGIKLLSATHREPSSLTAATPTERQTELYTLGSLGVDIVFD